MSCHKRSDLAVGNLVLFRKPHLTSIYSEVHINQQLCFPISQKLRKKLKSFDVGLFFVSIIKIYCC